MQTLMTFPERVSGILSGRVIQGAALLTCRIALAGVFWRAGRTKIEEGTLLSISESTRFLFEYEYSGVPLPTELSLYLATYAEHIVPILLVLGLATRLSALALLGMTMMIQFFVYPDAWWAVHSLWAAMCLVLISAGGGALSLDEVLMRRVRNGASA
ncbi:MAG: DoxX family protein [Halieaceae bacterium]|jgi:putative oxidoreductase|nr:DoxX family protein [Halieaceae bacterium]